LLQEGALQSLFDQPEVRERISAETAPVPADVFVIAVPTPAVHGERRSDLTAVRRATESVARVLRAGNLVIVESTIPPRTCCDVVKPILESSTGLLVGRDIFLAHCPERVLPGESLMKELVYNDRIIGAHDAHSRALVRSIYERIFRGQLLETDDITAEYTKLMENTFRDVNIALANQFQSIAEHIGADFAQARSYANHHPRVNILQAGIGVGGHCIPVDPWFIYEAAPELSSLILAARLVNDGMPLRTARKVRFCGRASSAP
jgi:UDP-N-acetyl-D-mannosaminuronic acid dehydrogenase